ncbi:V-type ATP synthase subunit I [Candidatus Aerophobetes bacterium]|uniref:V-type ATP synthase subunit I n=1 Tax=Aerophobetes bacterium TaxID=2030807 RepID=A0A523QMU8_UNCAE|nr:MAG: V-type ATP synthase subunit I [Candidatus Aerophobetes bacterium]
MAVAEMRKVYLIAEKSLRDSIITRLRELALFQVESVDGKSLASSLEPPQVQTDDLEEAISHLGWTVDYLEQFEDRKPGLGLFPAKIMVRQEDYLHWIKNFDWEGSFQRCSEYKSSLEKLGEEKNNLSERLHLLHHWEELPLPLEKLGEGRYVSYQPGIVSREDRSHLERELDNLKTTYLITLKEEANELYFLLVYSKKDSEQVESIFQKLRVEKVFFTEVGSPRRRITELKETIDRIEKEITDIETESRHLAGERIKLMTLHDHFYNLLGEKKVALDTRSSSYTFVLEGWLKKKDLSNLKKGLGEFSSLEIVVRSAGDKEEQKVPVALSNPRIFKPFEVVTHLYGLPLYIEIDPTPFMAPFFAIFLALCLTDGGYGVVLALAAYVALKKLKIGGEGRKLLWVLFISGLVTIAVGAVTGGIFGIQFSELPAFLSPLQRLVLFNPLTQPMVFLVIALCIGIVHILVGISLEIWDHLRNGRITPALLDEVPWVLIIIGGVLFGLGKLGHLPGFSSTLGIIMLLGGLGTLLLFAGRSSKNLFIRFGKGVYELYGLVGLFGDILSYSRLLALGLATSVIATVVNTIAKMASEIPLMGPVLMVVILIAGHMGNIGINCLSGFIHTARLQFVEFFGKFYLSGGESFRPFRREAKYILLS